MLVYGDKKYKSIGITNGIGLDTSDADIIPTDMQSGRIAYANGERVVGAGKCFAKAGYGQRRVSLISDENGDKKYGISISATQIPNIIFVSSTAVGDIVRQEYFQFKLEQNQTQILGINNTISGRVKVYYDGVFLHIYFENIENTKTKLMYFYGKDNYI